MPKVNRFHAYTKIKEAVDLKAELVITDDSHIYDTLGNSVNHDIVNHSAKQYVVGNVYINRGLLEPVQEGRDRAVSPGLDKASPAVFRRVSVSVQQS
jgi:hypothetical protein